MKRITIIFLIQILMTSFVFSQAVTVDIPITLTDNAGGIQELRFGLAPGAGAGIDEALGELELPPFPPSGVFEARFVGEDISLPELGQGSYKDYRTGDTGYQGTVNHELRYQVGAGTTITITWNLPEGVTGLLQDLLGGIVVNVAMQGQGNHTITNPGVINKLKMVITYQFTAAESLTIIQPNGGEQWRANQVENINWIANGIENLKIEYTINNGFNWETIIESTPAAVGYYPWTLPELSSLLCKVKISDASDGKPFDVSDSVFTIISKSDSLLHIPLVITDGAGGIQELGFGLSPKATHVIDEILGERELPPFPPSGVFDARFIGDDISIPELGQGTCKDYRTGNVNFNGAYDHEIRYQVGEGDSITIKWHLPDRVKGLLQDLLGGIVVNEKMQGTDSFVVANPNVINKLKMTITYALGQIMPLAPILITPENGATNVSIQPMLCWQRANSASSYRLQVSTSSKFLTTILDQSDIADSLFAITNLAYNTTYYWHVNATNTVGTSEWSSTWSFTTAQPTMIEQTGSTLPEEFMLGQNYPNPFNPVTTIEFSLAANSNCRLEIFDTMGRAVQTLVQQHLPAGNYRIQWHGGNCASGSYYYRLTAEKFANTKKLMLLK